MGTIFQHKTPTKVFVTKNLWNLLHMSHPKQILHMPLLNSILFKFMCNLLNTLPPDSCEHCPHPVDRPFKLSTLQLCSTVRVPLNEHNFSQYKHI